MSVEVYAPASMGNISVGFDLLGAALAPLNGELLGDKVRAERCATGLHLTVSGPYAERLPSAVEDNIVWQCAAFSCSNKEFRLAYGYIWINNYRSAVGLALAPALWLQHYRQ